MQFHGQRPFDQVNYPRIVERLTKIKLNKTLNIRLSHFSRKQKFHVIVNGSFSNSFDALGAVTLGFTLGSRLVTIFLTGLNLQVESKFLPHSGNLKNCREEGASLKSQVIHAVLHGLHPWSVADCLYFNEFECKAVQTELSISTTWAKYTIKDAED